MRTILRIRFGSHLYGTDTPNSDLDFKSVFVPSPRDILLQRAPKTISTKRPKAEGEKNYAGETDEEAYSLQNYLRLLSEGQTVALDVLFAPVSAWTQECDGDWNEIFNNRHRLLTKRSAAFVGYVRQQANKYGIKGSRVAAARSALEILKDGEDRHGTVAKLSAIWPRVEIACEANEHLAIEDIEQVSGQRILHWSVCGRKLGITTTIKMGRECVQKLVDEYGARALQAERQEGIDWKALSHAVRVGRQALELLQTAHVTFPLPYAEHVKAIKLGQRPYQEVSAEIEELLETVEREAVQSTLPDSADMGWIEDFVERVYRREVTEYRPATTIPEIDPRGARTLGKG